MADSTIPCTQDTSNSVYRRLLQRGNTVTNGIKLQLKETLVVWLTRWHVFAPTQGARRCGPGVDRSEPDTEVASLRDFSAEGQLRAARGVRPGARRRGPGVDGREPGAEGGEGDALEQLASWEAAVHERSMKLVYGA